MQTLQKSCLVLTIIGAIVWGLIGVFDFNLVDTIFGTGSMLSRIIYYHIFPQIRLYYNIEDILPSLVYMQYYLRYSILLIHNLYNP